MLHNCVSVSLEIPEVFLRVEAAIQKMVRVRTKPYIEVEVERCPHFEKYVFAGGAISDLYLQQYKNHFFDKGYPFRDVDIFVDCAYSDVSIIAEELGVNVEFNNLDRNYKMSLDTVHLARFEYEGIVFELCFVEYLQRVEMFDFTFRSFYYKEGNVLTTKQAMEDIEKGQLTISSFHSPYRTLIRAFLFENRYGFTVKPESMSWLKWEMNREETTIKEIESYFEYRFEKSQEEKTVCKDKLAAFLTNRKKVITGHGVKKEVFFDESAQFPYAEQLIDLYEYSGTSRGYMHQEMYEKFSNFVPDTFVTNPKPLMMFDKEEVLSEWEDMNLRFVQTLKGYCLKSMFEDVSYFFETDEQRQVRINNIDSYCSLSPLEKIEVILQKKEPMYNAVMYWFFNNDDDEKPVYRMLKKIVMGQLKFSYKTGKYDCVFDRNVVIVEAGVEGFGARYEFRRVERGVYTLAGTNDGNTDYYESSFLHEVMDCLRMEYPSLFDYGIEGEAAINPPEYAGHFFKDGVLTFNNKDRQSA